MNARLVAEKLAARTTRWIGARWGESFPFFWVAEYPKSGGTWLARMISDYLQVPFAQFNRLPMACSCVVHEFGTYDPRLRRVFYLYRDGRDVLTSLYFDRLRIARHSDRPGQTRIRRVYEKLLGKGYDPKDIVRHLPRFIEYEFRHPGRGASSSWSGHIDTWAAGRHLGHVAYLSYEELRADCAATLGRAIRQHTGEEIDEWQMKTTVEKLSMKRQTARVPGEEDPKEHIRKGISGDWHNYFSREAAELFDHLAGDTLVRLGYEEDRRWPGRYDYPTA